MPDSKAMFHAVDDLVKSWSVGEYVHHVRHVKDTDSASEFLVIFSMPQPTKPVPELVAQATFTVKPAMDEEAPPKISYTVETQQQRIPGHLPIRTQWLDAALRRKQVVAGVSHMFATTSNCGAAALRARHVQGDRRAVATAEEGLDDNEERLRNAYEGVDEAQQVAARNWEESVHELEELLVSVFNDADKDGNGYLDLRVRAVLDTADLGLGPMEKKQLLVLADANGDGRIEYAEFAPLGADVIQTMRLRKLNAEEAEQKDALAEMQARDVLHGLGAEEVTKILLDAFVSYDTDGSGRLERKEILECLQSLDAREHEADAEGDPDDHGVRRRGRLRHDRVQRVRAAHVQLDDRGAQDGLPPVRDVRTRGLPARAHIGVPPAAAGAQDEGGGALKVTTQTLKQALAEMDLVYLTPIQMLTLLSDAVEDDAGAVDVAEFCKGAATLVQRMCDPALEHKRMTVSKMATITPLQALTDDERARLGVMAQNVFRTFDADGSGKLDRFEFHKCLTESKLGLTERQIAHMMASADVSEDGLIDYGEFVGLFESVILELARADAIDRMLTQQAHDETRGVIVHDMQRFIDELMIPLHIAFDIASEGSVADEGDAATVDAEALKQMLASKAGEWGVHQETLAAMFESIDRFEKLTWGQLVEIIEQQHAGTVIE